MSYVPAFPKPRRLQSKRYLAFVRQQPCAAHPARSAQAHHSIAKGAGGSDYRAIPLCWDCHSEIHRIGMLGFAARHNVNIPDVVVTLLETYLSALEEV